MSNLSVQVESISRRAFHSSALTVAASVHGLPAAGAAPTEPGPIRLGVVGLGSRGFNLLDDFLRLPECEITAVCDVDDLHHRDRNWGEGRQYGRGPGARHVRQFYRQQNRTTGPLSIHSDFRQLIAAKDVDAVVVATPDHWHAVCTLTALEAGKDVYCEKPITHLFAEGQQVVDSVARNKAVFQTGSQQRSAQEFQRLVMLARNGVLGKIDRIEVGLPPGYAQPMGSTDVQTPRAGMDYDFWCGPAPVLPLMQARHHRWWRGHRAYGGGVLMDWIGHHNDIAHWAIGAERSGPVRVEAVDWTFPQTDVYDTPQHYTIRSEYESGVRIEISSRHRGGLTVFGSKGRAFANRGKLEASSDKWTKASFFPSDWAIGTGESHAANFLSCIRDRSECIAPAAVAHRSITPGHLGYVSQATGKALRWDPVTETIVSDADADVLLKTVNYRAPWKRTVDA
ncbi:MAG: Gfo/Idh/MocA family oxidoreductase [Planctomycetaceae bacterium]|nr:Gfo/Idh/MocA family oxidoreductase [Planctomycetaceae bacterium]